MKSCGRAGLGRFTCGHEELEVQSTLRDDAFELVRTLLHLIIEERSRVDALRHVRTHFCNWFIIIKSRADALETRLNAFSIELFNLARVRTHGSRPHALLAFDLQIAPRV